jgi:hypothetical protein
LLLVRHDLSGRGSQSGNAINSDAIVD